MERTTRKDKGDLECGGGVDGLIQRGSGISRASCFPTIFPISHYSIFYNFQINHISICVLKA